MENHHYIVHVCLLLLPFHFLSCFFFSFPSFSCPPQTHFATNSFQWSFGSCTIFATIESNARGSNGGERKKGRQFSLLSLSFFHQTTSTTKGGTVDANDAGKKKKERNCRMIF
jgi:hypothetical protein